MFGEDVECGGAVSFAELERQEADRFSRLLVEVDNRLYTQVSVDIPNEDTEADPDTRRYYSEGYEANYEGVSDNEILQWQQGSFTYLRAEGVGIETVGAHDDRFLTKFQDDDEGNSEHVFEELDLLPFQDEGLIVCGRSIVLPSGFKHADMACEEDASDSEYFAQHGILQEYMEYCGERTDTDQSNNELEQRLNDPLESQKEEVLASMVDAIWPDIVQALRPIVTAVLIAARDNNIPYKVDQNPAPLMNEYGEGGGFDFASDDGW